MDKEGRFWVAIVVSITTGVLVLVLGCQHYHNARISTYVENGYTRTTLQGSSMTWWVKIN